MFLSELNENERKTFLELAHHAISSDGTINDREKIVFNSYTYECELPDYVAENIEIENLIRSSMTYAKKKRIIILIELWGIVLADDELSDKESVFMDQLANKLEINDALARRIKRWAKDFLDIIGDGYRLISGEE